ncbi:TIGR04283 family arsenosugar biosynthesis glycosyltransferase [Winogradskyella alexanderae]|uniref:TIGR04283 family arsenosugar biosynthesis glycosyltransferase n=1 Tax=Winogradskyella alexanderae TaxID=2877123 RepID=A0ABS7XR92_9FLAO|nr:TIGR04283 family arsenosugar biosynthesis glycosyltransferase [Winogradskyella alexanderae]MCA0132537.1 TIGR04283 family arsenosugar biosynthesis glycosyltransferase [Winogradskyella alexanderae]
MSKISIIIPVLNEEKYIEDLLYHLLENCTPKNISEIIVVDGGSNDDTCAILNNFCQRRKKDNIDIKFCLVEQSPKGRAMQMNTGAEFALGDVLYFLHADALPPKNFDALILKELSRGNNAGCFRMQFDSNHWWLRLASWFTQFNWRPCRGGDQSQFITRALFDEIGGYDENYRIYEDNILINELYARNEFVVINKKIKTSARQYKKTGIWKLQYHFWRIYVKRWFGASATDIYSYYKKHIAP